MRSIDISRIQQIVNKCNSRKDFTFNLSKEPVENFNYIVSVKNICKTVNPSLEFDLNKKIKDVLERTSYLNEPYYDSIGMWKEEDIYHIDANVHVHDIDSAMRIVEMFPSTMAIYDIQNKKVLYVEDL